jgi:hypothetical protein
MYFNNIDIHTHENMLCFSSWEAAVAAFNFWFFLQMNSSILAPKEMDLLSPMLFLLNKSRTAFVKPLIVWQLNCIHVTYKFSSRELSMMYVHTFKFTGISMVPHYIFWLFKSSDQGCQIYLGTTYQKWP